MLWSYDVRAGVIGTPGARFGPTSRGAKAGILLDAATSYDFAPHVAQMARGMLVEHVFTDHMFGPAGAMATAGVAFRLQTRAGPPRRLTWLPTRCA